MITNAYAKLDIMMMELINYAHLAILVVRHALMIANIIVLPARIIITELLMKLIIPVPAI